MPSKIYVARETATTWKDSTGTLVMTLNNLVAAAVRVGARLDLGAASTPRQFTWRLTVRFETAPVVGEVLNIFLSWSDGTKADGGIGTADAAGDTNLIKNLKPVGNLIVSSTDADHEMTASGICIIPSRYVSPAIENATVDNLKATANVSTFTIEPGPPEIQ